MTSQALAQGERFAAMAENAERPEVQQIAFAAALDYRHDVVGVPQRFTIEPLQSPFIEQLQAMRAAGAFQPGEGGAGIHAANRADAAVAGEHPIAKIARIGAELPFIDAPVRAKRESPRRNFEVAPTAERPSVCALLERGAIGESTRHGA